MNIGDLQQGSLKLNLGNLAVIYYYHENCILIAP